MGKRITDREFFERKAEKVARDLIGMFVYCKYDEQEYQIIETEAYHHNDTDNTGKYICYGVKDDKDENIKTSATFPLFRSPGTWCVYGGQLLLSVKNSERSDNVLIKKIKTKDEEVLTTDGIAKKFLLYQKKGKNEKTNYWDIHGFDSLSDEAVIYLTEGENASNIISKKKKRVGINNDDLLNFYINGE